MSHNHEHFEGPVQQWEPSPEDRELIRQLLESDDELDNAYGEAYTRRCFVREFAPGLTAVGDLDKLAEIEFRHGIELDPAELTLGDCVELSYPCDGETRAERVLDGVRQVVTARAKAEEPEVAPYEYSPALYINMRAEEAIKFAESNGHTAKIARRDGLHLDVHDGIDPNRLKFTVRDGYVVTVRVG